MKLHLTDLSKSYHKGKIKALDEINITLTSSVYGLLGPNGAGKSTLINLIVGNLQADSGNIQYNDADIKALGQRYRELLGYMPQGSTPKSASTFTILYRLLRSIKSSLSLRMLSPISSL